MPEPALGGSSPPTPPHNSTGGRVISLSRRRQKAALREREEPMPGFGVPPSPEQRLAAVAQSILGERGLTLTDPGTANAFLATVEYALYLADATAPQPAESPEGATEDGAHRCLWDMLQASLSVPDTLDPDRSR